MIDEIEVHNLALIRQGQLRPCSGLTVLTGETGAGKTALLTALKLLMGARASSDMVRDGEQELSVTGRFLGLGQEDGEDREGEVVALRTVNSEGRSRARINGSMASVHELVDAIAPSIDLCGQFEHQQLMRAANHVTMLDAWAAESVGDAQAAYLEALARAEDATANLVAIQEARQLSGAKLDEARFIAGRIDEVDPQEGEYEQLKHDLQIAENGEALMRALTETRKALTEDEGALDRIAAAVTALDPAIAADEDLAPVLQLLREAGYLAEDAAAQLRDYESYLEFDPAELADQQERFASLQGLLRTYGPRMEDVLAKREEAARIVAAVDDSEAGLAKAQRDLEEAERELASAADALDAARSAAAPGFADQVSAIMGSLQMGEATITCAFERLPRERWGASGPSSFEFLYQPVSDGRPRPLTRIASGGEMSRVMLALKVVLGAVDEVDTLVFDEVDAGVGGAVAIALAEVLQKLAETHQVIVVTHLPQVAVRGEAHYVVERQGDETEIKAVTGAEREEEIARMLAGSVTETSLTHARELLAKA